MKHLALVWADGSTKEMRKFDFVFHISLKSVNENSTLEDIIISQHKSLKANGVKSREVKSILERESVLLLMDGFDEYTKGINKGIDEAIEKENLWNCWIIVTSRVIQELEEIKPFMDAEAAINGFSEAKVKEYASKFLDSEEDGDELIEKAQESRIINILSIPIILQMLCVLFRSSQSLPETRTGILKAIVKRCIDCALARAKVKPNLQIPKIHDMLVKLGGLAWKSLQSDVKQLLLTKVTDDFKLQYTIISLQSNILLNNKQLACYYIALNVTSSF